MAMKYIDEPIYWAPQKKLGGGWICFKDTPTPPPPPDYIGAAKEQGIANVEAARTSAKLSNPDVYTPYGNQTVTYGAGGDLDRATVRQTFSPEGQLLFEQDNRIKQGLGDLAEGGIDRVGGMLGSEFDMSEVSARPNLANTLSRDAMTKSIIDRNQPMMDRQRAALETQLANQGITRGSEAYGNSMDDLAREENDFRLGAIQQGGAEQSREYGVQSAARDKDIQTQAYLRQLPLNEINALRTGAQVNAPQFQPYQGQNAAPTPIFGATQAQGQANQGIYNANAAGTASSNSATMGLLGTGMTAAAMF